MAAASVTPPPGFKLDEIPEPPPGFVLDGPSKAPPIEGARREIPQGEPLTFAEKHVAPLLEKVMPNGRLPINIAGVNVGDVDPRNNPVTQALADPGVALVERVANNPLSLVGLPNLTNIVPRKKSITSLVTGRDQNTLADAVNAAIAKNESGYQASRGEDANTFDPGRVLTNVLNPLGLKGAGMVPRAETAAKRIGQGVATGVTAAELQPIADGGEDYQTKKAKQGALGAVTGGVLGGGLELARPAARGFMNLIDSFLPGGKERAVGRTVSLATGPRREQVISELEKPQSLVPGSIPTAGEAATKAGSAEFSALDKLTRDLFPSESMARGASQSSARANALQSVGKTPDELTSAVAARDVAAKQNYGDAFAQAVKTDQELVQLSKNPYFKSAVPEAMNLAKADGIDPKKNLTALMHYVKISMDDQIGKVGANTLGAAEKRATTKAKAQLVAWLEKNNPSYAKARGEFAEASVPINQMEVGQELGKKLHSALDDAEQARSFATAVRESPGTIKKATGQRVFDELSDILTPEQIRAVEGVQADLARKAEFGRQASAGMPKAKGIVETMKPNVALPHFLDRTLTIANAVLKRLQGQAQGKSLEQLAKDMQDPATMAKILRAATELERQQIVGGFADAVKMKAITGSSVAGAEEVGHATAGRKEQSDVQTQRFGGDGKLQDQGLVRVERPDTAGGGSQADTGGGVRQAARKVAPAPRDPKDRVVGQIYVTPRGKLKWTGEVWLKPD